MNVLRTLIGLRITPELYTEVKVYCAGNNVKIQDFVQEALQKQLSRLKKAKKDFK